MCVYPLESMAMRVAGVLGLRKLRWSLRRLHVPVAEDALVLEVGAGGNPYPRSNVLLDGFEDSLERQEKSLVNDRPLVLGLCEKLPFRDKAFDFLIASHVLEHTDNPDSFLLELQRVSKAGYIETPDAFFERINPFTYHRLEVASVGRKLLIKKKTSWNVDTELVDMYENKLKNDVAFQHYIRVFPDALYTRFYWSDTIEYEVINPEGNASWEYPQELSERTYTPKKFKETLRELYLGFFRKCFSQNDRNSKIELTKLLRCVVCSHVDLEITNNLITCKKCDHTYPVVNGVPNTILSEQVGANQVRSQSPESIIGE